MKSKILTPAMESLRPDLGEVVSILEAKAPYGSVSLSSREMTRYMVDNNQERVMVGEPTAGVILRAYGVPPCGKEPWGDSIVNWSFRKPGILSQQPHSGRMIPSIPEMNGWKISRLPWNMTPFWCQPSINWIT